MEERKQFSSAELRVVIFVLVAGVFLATALFMMGSTVGLFQETFYSRTYLNNVSSLKPGDIVLLGGVEIGNVIRVEISRSDETPQTEQNIRSLQAISELSAQETIQEARVTTIRDQLANLHRQYKTATLKHEPTSQVTQNLQDKVDVLTAEQGGTQRNLSIVKTRLQKARNDLQNIVVLMQIRQEYRDWIRLDSHISLGSVGLLGDKYVDISLGRSSDRPQVVKDRIKGFWGDREIDVVEITGRTQTGYQELVTGANDILANFQTLSSKIQDIVGRFEAGEGTVGKLINDPSFYNNLNATVVAAKGTVNNASELMQEIRVGAGTLPLLLRERTIFDKIEGSFTRLENILTEIEKGQGSAAKLINNPELYDNADRAMASLLSFTQRLETGEGTLGQLSKDNQLYTALVQTLAKLSGFVNDIEEGKGTLGRLAKDEQLYQSMNQLSGEVLKLIYDFRQNPRQFITIKLELF
jgi:phospholipid/cholesterol/gamma-HCH transport system substrate-binding protein